MHTILKAEKHMNNNYSNIQEDEIDLRELFKTLMKRKKFIMLFTAVVTVAALIYAYTAPKVYEAVAIVKIGEYKLANNTKVVIADASELSKELEILFIDILKNEKERDAEIENISLLKQQKNFLEISALGSSNEAITCEVKKVIDYIQIHHKKKLDDVLRLNETNVKQLEGKLELLKNKTLPSIEEKIERYKDDIKIYETNFINVQDNLQKIKIKNPTLAALQISEQRYLADMLIKLKDSLEEFQSQKNEIEVVQIEKLKEELNALNILMKPYNYKNTEVVGKIMTNDYAIKPKKKLIVVVAFITGLILSIFLVFFIEFIRNESSESTDLK